MQIHIEWDDALSLEKVSDYNGSQDYGLYQIYGAHPVYGTDVLLYIGKADRQTFKTRILQHTKWDFNQDYANLRFYLGRLGANEVVSGEKWSEQIDIAERLLIYTHKPAYNSSNINTVSNIPIETHVFNWGSFRSLSSEVSAFRHLCDDDKHFPTYAKFCESNMA